MAITLGTTAQGNAAEGVRTTLNTAALLLFTMVRHPLTLKRRCLVTTY